MSEENVLTKEIPEKFLADWTFGRRNFMELSSVFTSPPVFKIIQGRHEIVPIIDPAAIEGLKFSECFAPALCGRNATGTDHIRTGDHADHSKSDARSSKYMNRTNVNRSGNNRMTDSRLSWLRIPFAKLRRNHQGCKDPFPRGVLGVPWDL